MEEQNQQQPTPQPVEKILYQKNISQYNGGLFYPDGGFISLFWASKLRFQIAFPTVEVTPTRIKIITKLKLLNIINDKEINISDINKVEFKSEMGGFIKRVKVTYKKDKIGSFIFFNTNDAKEFQTVLENVLN